VVSVVIWATVVVRVPVMSGRVFANCSPRLVSLSRVVWSGVRPLLGLYKNLLFSINASKRNAFCVFVKKNSQHVLEIFLPNLSDTNKLNYLLQKYLVARR
jgi:hypothetical protein